ncbi:RNA methyltransferase [Candidatus Peregrinibacteria bacterium]|nr:RNA methyltransferase [Candidatus Peregrinibacteria bacterium]
MHLRLLAHNIRSLWNVGSFFRTCDALNVEQIYLTGYTGHPPRKEITKTALGAEEFVLWEHHEDPVPILKKLKQDGWQIVALEQTTDAIPLNMFPLPRGVPPPEGEDTGGGVKSVKILLLVGHELQGVPGNILSLCDAIVEIPMLGKKESLNVAVAAGIALWHLRK